MNFNSIRSPEQSLPSARFKPGRLLWAFVVFFLPLFISLGVWQLNRAVQKEQLLAERNSPVLVGDAINWQALPLYRDIQFTGNAAAALPFLLDNKTHNGQFGYEVFQLYRHDASVLVVSLGWVAGSADRTQLPVIEVPTTLTQQPLTLRPEPVNPLFDVDTNPPPSAPSGVWIVQGLTADWISRVTGYNVLGFAQLHNSDVFGVGPVVWQPTVMSPARHRGYALQWFTMAIALLGMFLYAGFKR
ncbi:SURF1 family protein [Reinekea sp. G2M2-21]|uniref:SURF1 family protein n=1 Tax=Reinekea sp. G2M2-21 TaxID=2788942 RepID=UPI0018A924E0|nr:SURF1 family protein [Reinekea sp. G2M2-21]